MKFSGKMCLKIALKVTKNQGFSLSLEDKLFKKPQEGGWGWVKIDPPPPAVLGLIILDSGIKVNKKYYPQTLLK